MTHHRRTGRVARTTATLAGAWLLQTAAAGPAGPLADPTRPPAALTAPGGLAAAALPHQANRDTARAIAAAQRAAEAPALPPPAPVLVQAVQLPVSGPAVAVVDGRLVRAGEQIDGRTVLAIDAQGLLVQGVRGPERLWLLGGASKQAAGSIVHSQTARYQPAASTAPGAPGPARAEAQGGAGTTPASAAAVPPAPPGMPTAATPDERLRGPGLPATTGTNSHTNAAAAPLSLAKRTAP